jgi:hypothetical protein
LVFAIRLASTWVIFTAKDGFSKTEVTTEHPEYMQEDDEELMFSKDVISSAVKQLNPEQEKCIILMYIDDKSYRDISVLTGFSLNEVKSHIQMVKNLKILGKQNETINTVAVQSGRCIAHTFSRYLDALLRPGKAMWKIIFGIVLFIQALKGMAQE